MTDPLAITRGLALTDVGLAHAGLSREERLPVWRASLNAMSATEHEIGLGGWLLPGAQLWVESPREGGVLCELGWPDLSAGPNAMRWPLRLRWSWRWKHTAKGIVGKAAWSAPSACWKPGRAPRT